MNWVRQEAERIEKEAANKSTSGPIQRYDWKEGDNNLRLLPCWAAHGRIFRKEAEHWELAPGKDHFPCLLETWPSKTDHCPICDAIDKILAAFPELELRRQMPASKYAANVIDRDDEEKGVQIARFTPASYNWIMAEMGNPKIGDVTDIETGIDLKVVLKIKARKGGGTQKEYTPGWMPRVTPLHEDDDLVAQWLEGLYDLDKLKPYPDDEKIGEIISKGSAMVSYYFKKYKQDNERGRSSGEEAAEESRPARRTEVAKPEKEKKAEPKKRETAKSRTSTLDGVDPKGFPPCFAGLEAPEPHDGSDVPEDVVGTFGFNEDLEKCVICEHELRCMDAKEEKGL